VGPRAGLDAVEKRKFLSPSGFELRALGRAPLNQSLYRLHYAGIPWWLIRDNNSVLVLLRRVFVGDVEVSNVPAASICSFKVYRLMSFCVYVFSKVMGKGK
jgi:hypothetical protein